MQRCTIEWAPFRLRRGVSEADLLAASDALQEAFLKHQPGFVHRETLRTGEGEYADLVHWRSREEAEAAMKKAAQSSACHAYFAVMEMDAQDAATGVAHYESLRAYG